MEVKLPDNNIREFEEGATGFDIAKSISKSLAKSALAIKVNGKLVDLYTKIPAGAEIQIITPKDPEGLEIIRHDMAHILAQAIKELWPQAQITIGPVIENGFYYDIDCDHSVSTDDFPALEKQMKHIIKQNFEIKRHIWERDYAINYFKKIGEHYKAEIISDLPINEPISIYSQGDFADLCRGPHAPSTSKAGAFKLLKVAGAYWRGDSKNKMLQRIYGTAWATEEELEKYLHQLEEAEKRDHRKIGKQLDLFHLQDKAKGMVFWHPKGWTVYTIMQEYIRRKLLKRNYVEVKTPTLVSRSLWELSGHWEKFRDDMFTSESEDEVHALKPMNCPCHIEIFKQGTKSYKDLPLRMAEFGSCHRNEASGALHGLMRVRGFTQDDAHIFCTEDQINSETIAFCELLKEIYRDFGFNEIKVKFSTRPAVRAGSDEIWDKAEKALKEATDAAGLEVEMNPGEGAFYGPKLEFCLKDAIGREWQCGTIQADFVLPERLDANYIGSDGAKHRPVMLHRAILGTFERFMGILIENYEGKFPLWLAPIQAVIVTITNDVDDYARNLYDFLVKYDIRAEIDLSSDKIGYKIRHHIGQKIPYIIVLGKKEQERGLVNLRKLGSEDHIEMAIEEVKDLLLKEGSIISS